MAITRFDPFREFVTLQDRMNRLLGDSYRDEVDGIATRAGWTPAVDIYETPGHDLVIKAELPDVKREDVDVTIDQHTLTLTGTKHVAADVKEEHFRRIERRYGSFSRSFTLPNTVDPSKVSAEFKNGVLTVTLPYKEEAKPRTIKVEVAA